ncbi:hypothetical protein ACU61A_31810 [Pseudonocardia sichuanensis]
MKRLVDVARVQTSNWFLVLGLPLAVLLAALVLNVATFAIMGFEPPPEGRMTGALAALYVAMGIAHLQTMTQVFPFALGMSVTRRAFYAATALVICVQAAVYGIVLVVLGQIELATSGWGLGIGFSRPPFLLQEGVLTQWLAYTTPMSAVAAAGVLMGVIFKRWGQLGVYAAIIGGGALLIGLAQLVTWQGWWPAVGTFVASRSALELAAGYPLLLALLLGGAGWLVLRRTAA